MLSLLESLSSRLTARRKLHESTQRLSHTYLCRCDAPIFFPNTQCLSCQSALGFLPDTLALLALDPGAEPGTVRVEGRDGAFKCCANRDTPALCNWLLEADDATREKIKHDLREPYRTLLGHFRHEVGHYYWDLLVRDSAWLERFRQLFGDERASYAEALKRHYDAGPPADWPDAYITSYATTHPWEDWAETWAHYLHVVGSLGTALGFGLDAEDLETRITPFTKEDLYAPDDPGATTFLSLLNSWVEIIMVLNELARSMGQPDFYPFVMSKPAVAKLQFVQMIVLEAGSRAAPDSAAAAQAA